MLKSMTGYGRGKYLNDGREYTVEIKTINHRYNDMIIKMPRYLNFLEDNLRQHISQSISRGKTEVYISMTNLSDRGRSLKVDRQLAGIYINELKGLIEEYDLPNDITATSIARLPDIIIMQNEEDEELFWSELKVAADIAISSLIETRQKEGEKLKQDIETRLQSIVVNLEEVEKKSSGLLDEYKNKLENRIKELDATNIIDESRIGVEIVMFADKSSICEEITRLKSHISQLKGMLNSEISIGKKLDFLVQEMNREVNTIGSKANSLSITKYVVEMKNEIENIREQIQNIE